MKQPSVGNPVAGSWSRQRSLVWSGGVAPAGVASTATSAVCRTRFWVESFEPPFVEVVDHLPHIGFADLINRAIAGTGWRCAEAITTIARRIPREQAAHPGRRLVGSWCGQTLDVRSVGQSRLSAGPENRKRSCLRPIDSSTRHRREPGMYSGRDPVPVVNRRGSSRERPDLDGWPPPARSGGNLSNG